LPEPDFPTMAITKGSLADFLILTIKAILILWPPSVNFPSQTEVLPSYPEPGNIT